MQLIGVAGKARAGKDTVGNYLCDRYGFTRYAMAGPLKAMLQAGLGLDPNDFLTTEQKEAVIPRFGRSYRYLAQTLGTDWMRELVHPDGWLIIARRILQPMMGKPRGGVVITDVRFDNEAELVRSLGGQVWHIIGNPNNGLTASAMAHKSESGVGVGPRDRIIFNQYATPGEASYASLYRNIDSTLMAMGVDRG